MQNKLLLALMLSLPWLQVDADYSCLFARAFAHQDIVAWERVLDSLGADPELLSDPNLARAKLLGLYGSVAWYIQCDERKADGFVDELGRFVEAVGAIPELYPEREMMSVAYAYFKAYLNPWFSPYYAGLALLKLSSVDSVVLESPFYWTELGNSKYHVPGYLGRDYQASAEYYEHSISIFVEMGDTACNWYFLNTLLWLARSYQKGHNVRRSLAVYHDLLSYQPEFDTIQRIIDVLEADSTARF